MPDDALRIEIDTPQWRIDRAKDRLYTQITGKFVRDPHEGFRTDGWDIAANTGVWWEPITGKLMLNPLPRTAAWKAGNAGVYARLQKANFTFADSTQWQDVNYSNEGSVAVETKDSTYQNFQATTISSYSDNTPFYFAPMFFGSASETRGYAACSFGGYGVGVDLYFYASGVAEVYKAGSLVLSTNWSGNSDTGSPQNATNQRVGFFIFAMPPSRILVVTTWGGGFTHIFDDLDRSGESNAVLPGGNWAWWVNGMKPSVESAQLLFEASGTAYSIASPVGGAPDGRTPNLRIFETDPGFGNPSRTVDYNGARFSVAMSSGTGQTASHYISAVDAEYEAVLVETPDEALDITDWVKDCHLSAGMDPGSYEIRLSVEPVNLLNAPTDPEDPETQYVRLDPDGTRDIYNRENRTFSVWLGDLLIMDGIAAAPEFDDSTTEITQRLHFTVRDKQWTLLEDYRLTDPTALDGYTLKQAFEKLIGAAGNDDAEFEVDDEAAGVSMETSSGTSQGDFAYMILPRETGASATLDLHQKYAGDWWIGTRPRADGPIFQILSPTTLGENAEVIMYESKELADGDEWEYPLERVFRSYNDRKVPIECNQLHIWGCDKATRRPIVMKWEDLDSQDPTKANADKPDNWTGTIRKAALQASALRTVDAVQTCGEKLWRKVSYRRTIAEIDCEMITHPEDLYPLWPGDCIELAGRGIYRIQGLSVSLVLEHVDTRYGQRRPTHYLLEKLEDNEDARGLGHVNQKGLTVADVLSDSLARMKRGIFDVEEQLRPIWSRTDAP